ncbi:MAG: hypothetical protein IKB73_04665 [Ruminococcus sp.]|nr:hypothetical protein [Ruminococcus sp.]
MKIFRRITTAVLVVVLLSVLSTSVLGAQIDTAKTNASSDVSLLAADFEISGTKLESDVTLPSFYSSKDLGYTTPVRNQIYNTCWAYSAMSTLETTLIKQGLPAPLFAPMHLNHWGVVEEDGKGWNRGYTGGGYSFITLGYLTSWQGPLLESDYPENTPVTDFATLTASSDKQVAVDGLIYLDTGDIETVKTAVYEYGALVGNYHVNENYYNSLNDAYFCNEPGIQTSKLNGHAISIVGWDDSFSKENFNESARPENDGAWLCKNSWGENWGDEGYYWISYEDEYLFDTRFGHSYAFNDISLFDKTKTLYQNEVYGATYQFEYISNQDSLTYINVFDADENYDTIEKVNFETVSHDAKYNIYSIPLENDGTPEKDKAKWLNIASGIVPYQGYISVDTEDFKVETEKFAIGVELIKNNGSNNSIGVGEWLTSGGNPIFLPHSDYGQSYLFYGHGVLMDAMDFYKDYLEDDIGGTFVIKAVAKESEKKYSVGDVDLDGQISVLDATCLQMAIAEKITLTKEQEALADVDMDGIISIMDATTIQQIVAGLSFGEDFKDTNDFEPMT